VIPICIRGVLAGALMFALMPALSAQKKRTTPPPAPAKPETIVFPLESVRVEGNTRIPTEKIVAASGLKIGKPVVKADFDAARDRLVATGAFMSVGYEFKPSTSNTGYSGVFQVVEVEQVFPYRFEDLPAPDAVLRAALKKQEPLLGDEVPGTKEVIDRYVKALEQTLKDLGAPDPGVTGKLLQDVVGHPVIVFRPPVSRPNISRVMFEGNDVLPDTLLVNTFAGVAIGAPYSEANLALLLDSSVRPLYEARGRVRVSCPKIKVARDAKVDGVEITVTVNEGPSYNLSGVRISGVAKSDLPKLEKEGNWKTGDIANFDEVRNGMDRITQYLRGIGYLRSSLDLKREVHDQDKTVDLEVAVKPGPQFVFGKLTIEGLDIISEPVIRKMWGDREGKPYDPTFPDAFLKDVREQGIFDNLGKTEAQTKIDDRTLAVAVTLRFGGAAAEDAVRKKKQPF
jgi:outer membrane protein insertion porin family